MVITEIIVCSKAKASNWLMSPRGDDIQYVVSIAGPPDRQNGLGSPIFNNPPAGFHNHKAHKLRLEFDDVEGPEPGWEPPQDFHVDLLIQFATKMKGRCLFHCQAGYSRSSAAAWICLTKQMGSGSEETALERLFAATGHKRGSCEDDWAVCPNRRMVWIADRLLGRDGAMRRAWREAFGHDCEEHLQDVV